MKSNRHLVISILLTLSLIAAPLAVAQPHSPSHGSFSVIEWIADFVQDVVAIFAPASTTMDPAGQAGGNNQGFSDEKEPPTEDDASVSLDPAG